jgi:hypothetical protein
MVLLISDRRLWTLCALIFLAIHFGLIRQKPGVSQPEFSREVRAVSRHFPRLLPRYSARVAPSVVKTSFDQRAAYGECR